MMRYLLLIFTMTQMVLAHSFWLHPQGNRAILHYGDGSEEIDYASDIVKKVSGMDGKGESLPVRWELDGKFVALIGEGEIAQMGAEIDEGYWVQIGEQWHNKSKRELPGSLASNWNLTYSKVLLKPQACLNRWFGYKLEITPVGLDEHNIKIRVKVDGTRSGVKLVIYDAHKKIGETDLQGEATLPYEAAMVIRVATREPLPGSPDADKLLLRAVLSLPARS